MECLCSAVGAAVTVNDYAELPSEIVEMKAPAKLPRVVRKFPTDEGWFEK